MGRQKVEADGVSAGADSPRADQSAPHAWCAATRFSIAFGGCHALARFSLRSKMGRIEMLSMVPLRYAARGHTNSAGAKFCNDYTGVAEAATEGPIEVERGSGGDAGSPRKQASRIDTAEPRALSGDAALRIYPTAVASPTIDTREPLGFARYLRPHAGVDGVRSL
jgi:hypothetical protein